MSEHQESYTPNPAKSREPASGFDLDVVGIGALNLDYISSTSGTGSVNRERPLTVRLSHLMGHDGRPLEWGVERQVDSHTIHAVIEAVSSSRPDTMLGGSAFNAIHAIGVVIVKRATGVWSHRREAGRIRSESYTHTPLSADQVEDATGAGDVFAVGLLVVLTSQRMQIELGALLGMQLARHKLRCVGNAGHARFAKVTRDFIRTLDAERRSGARPPGIFLSHGTNPEWFAVQRFIEDRFDSPVSFFESAPRGGHQVSEALSKYLERCSLAVCILTAEDFTSDGRKSARQSVIHEVGLFQGRHGFDRVVLLVEEGCDFVPEAAVPYTIYYPKNRVNRTFYQLAEIIKAHGFPAKEAS